MRKKEIRLPGLIKEEIGLGDAIKKVTKFIGIKPCSSCDERAKKLNSHVILTSGRKKLL